MENPPGYQLIICSVFLVRTELIKRGINVGGFKSNVLLTVPVPLPLIRLSLTLSLPPPQSKPVKSYGHLDFILVHFDAEVHLCSSSPSLVRNLKNQQIRENITTSGTVPFQPVGQYQHTSLPSLLGVKGLKVWENVLLSLGVKGLGTQISKFPRGSMPPDT